MPVVAQAPTPPPPEATTQALLWIAVLLGLVILVGVVLTFARKRLLARSQDVRARTPLTLHDLRRLHETGEISEEEFERLKEAMVRSAASGTDKSA